jgi:hypothetical protein
MMLINSAIFRAGLLIISALLMAALPTHALETPKERVVLTISGSLGVTNRGQTAVWDMAMLEALPQTRFTTTTPWDNGPVTFSGPLLRDVLAAVQARGTTLRATALNDYRIAIPASDAAAFDVIIATRMNDQPMSVRTKGPLFIIYPFDSRPELKSTTYFERSIWQLKLLAIE